jgi:hypothetical protein
MSVESKAIANVVIKIMTYCVWFCFVLWISCREFLIAALFRLPNWIGIYSPALRITIVLIPWTGFICLLLWLPVWLMKGKRSGSPRLIAKTATFLILLLACTVLNTVIWQEFVTDKLYNCTESRLA